MADESERVRSGLREHASSICGDASVAWGRSPSTCACRKSNPEILMMQPAQYRSTIDVPYPLNGARYWRILPHG